MLKFLSAISLFVLSLISPAFAAIQAGDALSITIKGVPASEQAAINGKYIVGKNGQLKVPLADVIVSATGLDHDQLSRSIENVYKKSQIYARPVITVESLAEVAPSRITVSVGGMVKRAGPVAYHPGMTLLQAIQGAGDMTMFGTKKRIFLTRGKVAKKLDLRKKEHQQFKLEAGDAIVVDQKGVLDSQ